MRLGLRAPRGFYIPAGIPRLDRNHRLSEGLAFTILVGLTPPTDLVYGMRFSTINKAPSQGMLGQETKFGNGNTTNDGIIFNATIIKTSDGAGGGDFTLAVVANPAASAQTNVLLSQRDGTPNHQVYLAVNAGGGGSGNFGMVTFAGTTVSVQATSQVDGVYHAFVGKRTGTTLAIYRDGNQAATSSGTVQAISGASQNTGIGVFAVDNTDNFGANCGIPIVVGWNRALTDQEIAEWSKSPTCFLIYPEDDLMAMIKGNAGASYMPFFTPPP